MFRCRVIPLFYESDLTTAKALIDACYIGGARVVEFTNRGENASAVFSELIKYCNENYEDMALGIGSIANLEQAETYINLGAHFLVSPFLDKEVAEFCDSNDILWSGGCATLTEMHTAYKWGVPILKLFPGNVLGPSFVKAAKAPCPYFNIMVTGGVKPTAENLRSWFDAGTNCVGMGSQLFVKKDDGSFDYNLISKLLKESMQVVNQVKQS